MSGCRLREAYKVGVSTFDEFGQANPGYRKTQEYKKNNVTDNICFSLALPKSWQQISQFRKQKILVNGDVTHFYVILGLPVTRLLLMFTVLLTYQCVPNQCELRFAPGFHGI